MSDNTAFGAEAGDFKTSWRRKILPTVMSTWEERVNAEVANTVKLNASVLVGALPLMAERIVEALLDGAAVSVTADSTLGSAHGRERALMTEYRPCDLIHELHIFRDVILAAFQENGVLSGAAQSMLVRSAIDEISRDSLTGYYDVREQVRHLFNSALSRDVRNVLNVVSVTAQLIEQKTRDPSVGTMARRIIGKVGEADGMLMSVTTERSLNRNLKLPLTIHPVTLLPLIENVCADFHDGGQRIRIVSDPIDGYWSWAAMESALRNLINYARQSGSNLDDITVSASVAFGRLSLSMHTEKFFLAIADIELLADAADYLLAGHLTEKRGLSYVQQVAESHGGSLVTRSSPEGGTTFTIHIPLDSRPYVES